jgi:hypothetical protein
MAIPLAIPIVAGVVGVGLVALRLRKNAKDTGGATSTAPSAVKNGLQPATAASVAALPPAVQAILSTPGLPPSQAAVNLLLQEQKNGTLDPASFAKGGTGQLFQKSSPQMAGQVIPNDQLALIEVGQTATIDVGIAGIATAAVPSGNMFTLVKSPADMTARTIQVTSSDPRVQDQSTVLVVPVESITGLG